GNVGAAVVRELRERGAAPRAFVRDRARAESILGKDIDPALGDLSEPRTLKAAMSGVERLFLACGNAPGQVQLESNAIDAARACGVQRIVKLSVPGASIDSSLLFPRWQAEIEQHLSASGIPA